jgi:hypothetical protein
MMKPEYNFSKADRGKFYRPDAKFKMPKSMDEENLAAIDNFDPDSAELLLRPRPSTSLTLPVPDDVLKSLQEVATSREMSLEGLLKLYIGKGLRQDLSDRRAARSAE